MATTPTYVFSRNERLYLQTQTTFGKVPASGGSATLTGANACRLMHAGMNNDVALLSRPDKTGTRSMEGMIGGRRYGRWTAEMATAANGTPGVLPDCDPILQAAFGTTATVTSGTSVAVSSSTDTTPIVVSASHGVAVGKFEVVSITGHTINVNANGVWLGYATDSGTLTLVGSVGAGLGAGSGGTLSRDKCLYTLTDEITYFTMWSYRNAGGINGNIDQRCANTCIVTEMTHNINQDVATWSAQGDCYWVISSRAFANLDLFQKGGLTSYPAEPTLPVTNGNMIPGFTGRFVAWQSAASTTAAAFAAGAVAFTTIRNATIRSQLTNALVRDTFGSYYATLTEGDVRNISISFSIYDDDSTEVNNLKTWGDLKTPIDMVINLGTVIGNTWVHYLRNVYLASNQLGDGQLRFDSTYNDSRATTTALAVRDEYQLAIA